MQATTNNKSKYIGVYKEWKNEWKNKNTLT
jgi:hypothetical protein